MDIRSFMRRHRAQWNELEELMRQFAEQPRGIGAPQIDRLTALYRSASSHLSYMRTENPADELTVYLNQLVSRAHHLLYQEQFTSKHQLRRFFAAHLPSLIRQRLRFIVAAALLLAFGGLSGFIAVWSDASNLHAVLPESIAQNVDPNRVGEGAKEAPHALLSTAIMTNNIRVAILAFVSGITFGIGTVYLLAYNGLIIGALAAFFWQAGKSVIFWAYILPHGIIELTAIFIAGGAGLYMGCALLMPGPYPRRLVLLRSAKESAQLLLGTIPFFVIAGLIEGYVTPSELPLGMKYAFAGITLLLLAGYLLYSRVPRERTVNSSGESDAARTGLRTSGRDNG